MQVSQLFVSEKHTTGLFPISDFIEIKVTNAIYVYVTHHAPWMTFTEPWKSEFQPWTAKFVFWELFLTI